MDEETLRKQLFDRWIEAPGIEFASPEARTAYRQRATLLRDAAMLERLPERVPVFPIVGFFPAYLCGVTPRDLMYDYDTIPRVFKEYVIQFQPDAHLGTLVAPPGPCFDILDYKLYRWPGHGVPPEHSYQAVDGEYMLADEYAALIRDPSYFFGSIFLPRAFGALRPFRQLAPLTNMTEMYGGFTGMALVPFGQPEVQAAYRALLDAGAEALKWSKAIGPFDREMAELGFPNFFGGGCLAPFDVIGDTLRGTRGVMTDVYRHPSELVRAADALVPIMIEAGASSAKASGNPFVFIPLHKGADGFLSDKQFKTFYWPSYRELLLGLIGEGCVPFSWAEGGYNTRLETICDLPRGKTVWGFDLTDMARAKETIGSVACIGGNLSISTLSVGTAQQVKEEVHRLIETCAKGGGYVLMNGAVIDNVKPENVQAMIEATKEYGVYSKGRPGA